MKISTLCDYIDPIIYQRGLDYFHAKAIKDLGETEKNFWQAIAIGTYHYDVEIELQGDKVLGYSCSCPYDYGETCKHVVATLLTIQDDQAIPPKIKKKRPPNKAQQLKTILNKTSHKELQHYLKKRMAADHELRDDFLIHFQGYTNNKNAFKKTFLDQCRRTIQMHSDAGFIDYYSAYPFFQAFNSLLNKVRSSSIQPNEKNQTLIEVIHLLLNDIGGSIDDSDGGLYNLLENLMRLIDEYFHLQTPVDQNETLEQLLELNFDSEAQNYAFSDHINSHLITWCTQYPQYQYQYFSISKNNLKSRSPYLSSYYVENHLNLLIKWGYTNDAESFAQVHIKHPACLDFFVDQHINKKEHDQAIALIHKGIQQAKADNHSGAQSSWEDKLLVLYKKLGHSDASRELLTQRFNSYPCIKNYNELKKQFSASEWQKQQTDILQQLQQQKYPDFDLIAYVMAEAKQYTQLLALVLSIQGIRPIKELIHEYKTILYAEDEQATLEHYAKAIRAGLKQTGRSTYEQAVKDFKFLQQTSIGQQISSQLAQEMCTQYSNRPLMLKLFKPYLPST